MPPVGEFVTGIKDLRFVTSFTAKACSRAYLTIQESGPERPPGTREDPTMNPNQRNLLATAAFGVTVLAGFAGLSLTEETKASPADQLCAHAVWPAIPDACLQGADAGRTVRMITPHATAAQTETMAARFALAFN